MTALALATALMLTPDARACDDDDCQHTVHIEASHHHHHHSHTVEVKRERKRDRDEGAEHNPLEIHVRGAAQYLPGSIATNVGVEGVARRDAYLEGDVRMATDGTWRGRASAGFDVFGGGKFDLKLGAFIGARGCFNPETMDEVTLATQPTFGGQLTVGGNYDRIYGRYRLSLGLGAGETAEFLTENEVTLGFRVVDELRVYGQYVALSSRTFDRLGGVGAGVEYVF